MAEQSATSNAGQPPWPTKTEELQNHHMDSHVWNDFQFRDDDIIICTWAKSGTTWTQQIVSQLIFQGADDVNPHELSPWLDMRLVPREPTFAALEAQTHRRFLKTHLPLENLVYSPKAKYLYVGRDGRDIMWSAHNHYHKGNEKFYSMINDTPGRVGPPLINPAKDPNPVYFFRDFLDDDSDPTKTLSPFWKHTQGFWAIRELPNLLMVHFHDLKTDMEGEIRRIAEFLEIDVPEEKWPRILEHCSFDYMKENAHRMTPMGAEDVFEGGGKSFINKGTNRRWVDTLTEEDTARYEGQANAKLGEDGARWLAKGRKA